MSLLSKVQIYGINQPLENAFLACLLTGEPGMLVGSPGSAKTEVVKVIAQTLQQANRKKGEPFNYHVYDASKLLPEDLMGYLDIELFKQKQIDYVHSKISIWDKNLAAFDEVNRADQQIQNCLFEILRSRKCYGLPTNLSFIFGTMNPYNSTGTSDLVDALIDRFAVFLSFPNFDNLSDTDKIRVTQRVGDVESVGLKYWGDEGSSLDATKDNTILQNCGDDLIKIMSRARVLYGQFLTQFKDPLTRIIIQIEQGLRVAFKDDNKAKVLRSVAISGRKAGMILRTIIATRAVQAAKAEVLFTPVPDFEATIINTVLFSMPIGVSPNLNSGEVQLLTQTISTQVEQTWRKLLESTDSKAADLIHTLFITPDYFHKLNILLENPDLLGVEANLKVWSTFLEGGDLIKNYLGKVKTEIPGLIPDSIIFGDESEVCKTIDETCEIELIPELAHYEPQLEKLKDELDSDDLLSATLHASIFFYNHTNTNVELEKAFNNIIKTIELIKKRRGQATNSSDLNLKIDNNLVI